MIVNGEVDDGNEPSGGEIEQYLKVNVDEEYSGNSFQNHVSRWSIGIPNQQSKGEYGTTLRI